MANIPRLLRQAPPVPCRRTFEHCEALPSVLWPLHPARRPPSLTPTSSELLILHAHGLRVAVAVQHAFILTVCSQRFFGLCGKFTFILRAADGGSAAIRTGRAAVSNLGPTKEH